MIDAAILALFVVSGFIAGATVAHSLRGAWRAWNRLQDEAHDIQPMWTPERRLRRLERRRKGR